MQRIIITIIFFLFSIIVNSQNKLETNVWVKLTRDSVTNNKLEASLNNFLAETNKGNFSIKEINQKHYKLNADFFDEFKNISKSNYYKDSLFYKPFLLKSFTHNTKDFYLTLQFTGVDSVNNKSITRSILRLKAIQKSNYYEFYSVFRDNLESFSSKKVKGITFYYQNNFNKTKAKKMVNFTKKLEKMTGKKSPLKTYYKCKNAQEGLKLLGIDYDFKNANSSEGFGWSDKFGNFITGVNSEEYIHDYIHVFFANNYNSKETWREFEEGIAIYYGGNWELSFIEAKAILIKQYKDDATFDFLKALKKGRKSKRYLRHLYDRLITAVLVEHILKIKDFKTVLAILHCGDNGENLLEKLNKYIGINENNFNEKFVQFLEKSSVN